MRGITLRGPSSAWLLLLPKILVPQGLVSLVVRLVACTPVAGTPVRLSSLSAQYPAALCCRLGESRCLHLQLGPCRAVPGLARGFVICARVPMALGPPRVRAWFLFRSWPCVRTGLFLFWCLPWMLMPGGAAGGSLLQIAWETSGGRLVFCPWRGNRCQCLSLLPLAWDSLIYVHRLVPLAWACSSSWCSSLVLRLPQNTCIFALLFRPKTRGSYRDFFS